MHYLIQSASRIKYEKIAHLYPALPPTPFYIFLRGYNSRPVHDIKLKFSAFLSFVEATKCVEFQNARCKSFKVDIFRINHIDTHTHTHTHISLIYALYFCLEGQDMFKNCLQISSDFPNVFFLTSQSLEHVLLSQTRIVQFRREG